MAQLSVTQRALPLSLAVAGSHATLEVITQILPVVYPLLIAERGFTYSQIGTVALVSSLCYGLTQPLFGWLSDHLDAKKIVVASIAWTAISISLVGWIGAYGLLLACIGLVELGSAAYHPSGASLAARFERKSQSMAHFATGGFLGSALSPVIIAALLTQFGLRGTLGMLPIGLALAGLVAISLRHMPAAKSPHLTTATQAQGSKLALTLIVLMIGAKIWFEGSLVSYLPEWQIQQGDSLTAAGSILALFLVALGVGGFISGFLSERFGQFWVVLISLILLPPIYLLFLNGDPMISPTALFVCGVLLGISNPISILMAQAAWPQGVGVASSMAIGIG
ncbi:MAG: MFS transporter, partial [Chloroflexota bacterium]